jgi:uncharacterized membrane protein (UPF0127 family)
MDAVRLMREGEVVCERCLVADSYWTRGRGLLGRKSLPAGEGILLRPASSVHMFFMRFAIDVVFLDPELTVLDVRQSLRPWRVAGRRGAHSTLELAEGEVARHGIAVGQQLVLAP